MSFNPEVSLNIVTPDSATSLSYTILNIYGTNEFAEVDIDIDDIYVSFNGVSPDFLVAGGDIIEASVGQITWGGGNVTQLLQIDIDIGDEVVNFIFRLGGATLPTFTTLAEFDAFGNSIAGIEVIPAGTPLSAGVDIPFTTIPGWTSISDTMINGTAGDDTLTGTAGNDVINPGANDGYDEIHGTSGDDVIVFSDSMMGDFYGITYEGLSGPINVTISDEYGQATVDKGADGTDLLIDILQAADWNTGDGVSLTGTDANDVFNLTMMEDSSWVGISGRGGNDTFNLYAGTIFRLDYRDGATTGINANLGTGVITDGQGGTDQVNYMSTNIGMIEVRATHFDDTILGTNLDERFILLGGDDTLDAGGGFDTLRYDRGGVDAITANLLGGVVTGTWDGLFFSHEISNIEAIRGSGMGDILTGNYGANKMEGGEGDDSLTGLSGNDTLLGEDGNDTIFGNYGNDSILGNLGDDSILGNFGDDSLDGGAGYDTIDAGLGNDTVNGGDGRDKVLLGAGADLYLDNAQGGINGQDTVYGNQGNDTIQGGNGNDVFYGGLDNDVIYGQLGADMLFGEAGYDTLYSGDGNDTVNGGDGRDLVFMGTGADIYFDNGQGGTNGQDTVYGNQGNDTIQGGNGNDMFYGGLDNDVIFGRLGADKLYGEDGFDTIYAGDGNDTVNGGNGRDVVFMGNGNDLYRDNAQGGNFGRDNVWAGSGDDTIQGGNGNDTFGGGAGDDLIIARLGDDRLDGGAGYDRLSGGDGADTFVFSTNFGEDAITDFTKGVDRLELDDALWTGTLTAAEVVAQFGDDTSGFVTLDFSTATEINYIIFEGLTSLDGIADTIDIV
ncbi:calcium-binding protein [Rhodalgimonas zhirmunskyi]|uniref:Calcium-binding protein n=1 Tax=Rhodalgimonas zhirmunskyi TaxID=2964767 RepID=A0AAJ1UC78_9RHOB|nr:calcium-binding protein [Rhodoalgimonas zhirmunskyi]MDQ2095218.1 hypothetical protein [Rhodoalgimonas zhirmunskyi]